MHTLYISVSGWIWRFRARTNHISFITQMGPSTRLLVTVDLPFNQYRDSVMSGTHATSLHCKRHDLGSCTLWDMRLLCKICIRCISHSISGWLVYALSNKHVGQQGRPALHRCASRQLLWSAMHLAKVTPGHLHHFYRSRQPSFKTPVSPPVSPSAVHL